MKALGILAAAFVGFFTVPSPASAYVQPVAPAGPISPAAVTLVSHAEVVQRWDDGRRYNRGRQYDRRDRRYRNRGYRNRGYRTRTVCRNEWRGGHRQRVCRQVRR